MGRVPNNKLKVMNQIQHNSEDNNVNCIFISKTWKLLRCEIKYSRHSKQTGVRSFHHFINQLAPKSEN